MLEAITLNCIRQGRPLFIPLSFSLRPGEFLWIQGDNGCGKTSLLEMLCGFIQPTSGKILWKGTSIRLLGEVYRRELLYCGHRNALHDDLTPEENIRFWATLMGYCVTRDQVHEALHAVGIQDGGYLPTRILSQGQKRRVSLARLMLTPATLWILDEPITALDTQAIGWLRTVLNQHVAQGGLVILTSHSSIELDVGIQHRLNLQGKEAVE